MLGPKQEAQAALFYEFSLEDHVPQDHLLRSIDRFVDLGSIRAHLADFYSHTGRPSVDPELLIRMLVVGYCFGIRSERRLCEEVHLNLAYRWFCRLDLADRIPDHSSFSKNRHGRFRESNLLRHVFEMTVARCIEEGFVGGQGFAADASLIHCPAGDLAQPNLPRGGQMFKNRTPAILKIGPHGRSNQKMPRAQCVNISTFWMMPRLALPARRNPNSRHMQTPRANGPRRGKAQHSLPIRTIISSTQTTGSFWMSRQPAPSGRPRLAPCGG